MKKIIIIVTMLSATSATSGGFEASRLDTKFMYEEGNYAELSYSSINTDIITDALTSSAGARTNQNAARDQNRSAMAFKTSYGNLDIGLTRYKSGTIQLAGDAKAFGTDATAFANNNGTVPETDVNMNTLTLMAKYGLDDSLDILLGVNRNTLEDSTVTTTRGLYTITGESKTAAVIGFAYSKPEIGLRVELLMQPSSKMNPNTSYAKSVYGNGVGAADVTSFASELSRPNTTTLNFQSGVTKDTLVFGSIHRTDWGSAQIDVPTDGNAQSKTGSQFWDTTTYTLGVARKISDSLALTGSFAKETGGKDNSASLFAVNNGYNAINIGARYSIGKVTISGGYNYTNLGDINIYASPSASTVNYASYKNNTVSAFGLKIGVNF